jgi:hypothetical protein
MSGVLELVVSHVFSASEPNLMVLVLLGIDLGGGWEVSHGVAASSKLGRIRLRTVDDAGFVERAFVWLQREVNRVFFLNPFHLGFKDIFVTVNLFVIAEPT